MRSSANIVRGVNAVFLLALAACTDRPDTYIVPLAELDAELGVGPDDRILHETYTIRLVADREPCLVLSPRDTRATLDGLPADIDMGNPEYSNRECYGPAMSWDTVSNGPGVSSLVLTDGSATWEMEIWQPFGFSDLTLLTPLPVRAGMAVTYRARTMGTISNAEITMITDSIVTLTEGNGVTRDGLDLTFTIPLSASPGQQSIVISADHDARIDRCVGPRRCDGSSRLRDRVHLEISP